MGFKKARASDGASVIIWDEESIKRMKETYGLRETSEISETSAINSGVNPDITPFPFLQEEYDMTPGFGFRSSRHPR